jgi:hypothetical protein
MSKSNITARTLEIGTATITEGRGASVAVPASGSIRHEQGGIVVRREVFELANVSIEVAAADDYGSVKIADVPEGRLIVFGGMVDLTVENVSGVSTLEDVDVAIGYRATSSTDFSGLGEQAIVAKIDANSAGVVQGGIEPGESPSYRLASSDGIYLNVSVALGADGELAASGSVEMIYLDLGA